LTSDRAAWRQAGRNGLGTGPIDSVKKISLPAVGLADEPRALQSKLAAVAILPQAGIITQTVPYPLVRANEALSDLRSGRLQGAAVLVP
jgi:hypothetical protein